MPPAASMATRPAGGGAAPRTALAHHHAQRVNGAAVIGEPRLEELGAALAIERAHREAHRARTLGDEGEPPQRPELRRAVEDDGGLAPASAGVDLDARHAAAGGERDARELDR